MRFTGTFLFAIISFVVAFDPLIFGTGLLPHFMTMGTDFKLLVDAAHQKDEAAIEEHGKSLAYHVVDMSKFIASQTIDPVKGRKVAIYLDKSKELADFGVEIKKLVKSIVGKNSVEIEKHAVAVARELVSLFDFLLTQIMGEKATQVTAYLEKMSEAIGSVVSEKYPESQ
jgi:hypothetical protein